MGNWLAATFPNIYGKVAGRDNHRVAKLFRHLFKRAKKDKNNEVRELDAQVLATAFAAYVTNSSLAGNTAAQYGFLVTQYGVGIATINVGTAGAAFGVADHTEMTIMDILLATNERADNGHLYYNVDVLLRQLANELYTGINEAGEIG